MPIRDATEVGASDADMVQIPAAAARANCSAVEIVNMLMERRLATVRRLAGERGFMSVLVSPEEVRPLVRLEDHGGLSLRKVEKALGTTTKVVKALLEHGYLPSRIAGNPVNRCPQTIVMQTDLDGFMSRYVTLTGLMRETGVHFRAIAATLGAVGVEPASTPLPSRPHSTSGAGSRPSPSSDGQPDRSRWPADPGPRHRRAGGFFLRARRRSVGEAA
ncbi:hypothetical protein [Aurantimonas sp. VKM B-3413]|uniref:hypothetical protein n=1 Tax=Aurantimonas sp. VKM B-3413 TaxID=2779401 RepID=UPI001E5FE0BB|nr:hypothetical protein [Aurantimonas sp. VKM B-3413]MCB8840620.1 hypothetical protein [Aurantimonas sp. VKM B-3413]